MWSYYGSKSKIINHYPPPKEDKIIEPFAGSARYALKYFDREVLLVDKYEVVVNLWKYLKDASEGDILRLPDMNKGDDLRNMDLSTIEKTLIGFCIGRGATGSRNTCGNFNDWNTDRQRIARNLHKIRHWEIKLGSYDEIENQKSTWFIDPPYQYGGEYYRKSNKDINFNILSRWCKSRQGQVIVCENSKADWMNFKQMIKLSGQKHTTHEVIWSNHKTAFDNEQLTIKF